MFPILETERLLLREITEEDAAIIFSILSKDEVTRYYGQETLETIDQAKDIIKNHQKKFVENRGFRWGIVKKDTNHLIGTIGLDSYIIKQRRADIGYEIHPDQWGKGYATEAALKVISYGFDVLNLMRIGAVVFPENSPSNKLLNRLGFQKEGTLRNYIFQNGKSFDTFVYSILNEKEQSHY